MALSNEVVSQFVKSPLSSELISDFAKTTNDNNSNSSDGTLQGTVVIDNGVTYVRLNNSQQLTPVNTTSTVSNNDRVKVVIENHAATIIGNLSIPSASSSDVSNISSVTTYKVTAEEITAMIATFNSLVAKTAQFSDMSAITAEIETLKAKFVNAEKITANDIVATNAQIDHIKGQIAEFEVIHTGIIAATDADINTLNAYVGTFAYLSSENLKAVHANITDLQTNKLSADQADIKYANIDFANIGELAVKKLFADSGMIGSLVMKDGKVTGTLVGVTIKGDLIEGGTVVADKLVIAGDDGLYYKLNTNGESITTSQTEYNSLNGSIITAKSVTAEQISVSDLVAFDATIGGFHISNTSLYSGVKASIENTTSGIYMDRDGQFSIGDGDNFLRYIKDDEGNYKLIIRATDGLKAITTNTGYSFNDDGLTVNKEGSEITTKITENGMTVNKNDSVLLTANASGVDAKDLKASTYLIIGGRSRFENYKTNRTGCFWIGE